MYSILTVIYIHISFFFILENGEKTPEVIRKKTEKPGFDYNYRGQLVLDGHAYSRHRHQGNRNCEVHWRCVKYQKLRCPAKLVTRGVSELVLAHGQHNHVAADQHRTFKSIDYRV